MRLSAVSHDEPHHFHRDRGCGGRSSSILNGIPIDNKARQPMSCSFMSNSVSAEEHSTPLQQPTSADFDQTMSQTLLFFSTNVHMHPLCPRYKLFRLPLRRRKTLSTTHQQKSNMGTTEWQSHYSGLHTTRCLWKGRK